MKGNYWKDLPAWAKGIVAVVSIGAVVFVGAKIYGLLKKTDDEKQEDIENDTTKQVNKELEQEIKNGTPLSHPDSVYKTAASLIQNELNGCEFLLAYEESVAKEVLRVVQNQADWLALIKAFGVRKIENCGWGSTMYSLPTLLKEQLGQTQWNFKSVWTNLSLELTKRGIKY